MKRIFAFILVMCLVLTLTACSSTEKARGFGSRLVLDESTAPSTDEAPTETTKPEASEETRSTTEPSTEPVSTTVPEEPDNSFTVYIHRGSFPVRAACRYGEPAIGTVGQAGTYTIVEEYHNEIGLRFGKLKSGVGWIDLTRLEIEQSATEIIFAVETNDSEIGSHPVRWVSSRTAPDLRYVELIPSKTLKNISIYTLEQENGDPTTPELLHIDHWSAGEPIIVALSFGSTKVYGIRATQDSNTLYFNLQPSYSGESRYYRVSSYTPANTGNSNLAPWQAAYLDYLDTLGSAKKFFEYRLVYVDSDEIPELFISGACEADGSIICSYQGGEVVSTYLRRLGGASYIPYSGLVHNCNGNMGYYTTDIYRLTDSGFVSLFWGAEEESHETVTNEAGQEETVFHSKFYIGAEETEVSEEEYLAAQAEIFDSTAAERLYIYNDSKMLSYTTVRERIRNW